MSDLQKALKEQKLSADDKEKDVELLGHLCGFLQVTVQKLATNEYAKSAFMQHTDQIMSLLIQVLSGETGENSTAHEEAMLAIGTLSYVTGRKFVKYMADLYKYLKMGLQSFKENEVCVVSVGVLGDICRAIEDKILPYCDEIIIQLLKDLATKELTKSAKPPIFSCFGDIALAIGRENFEKYLVYVMPMLQAAADLSSDTLGTDNEMKKFTNLLRT